MSYWMAVALAAYMGWLARGTKERFHWIKRCGSCELRRDKLVWLDTGPVWKYKLLKGMKKMKTVWNVVTGDEGQDIAEYAVMLAVILIIIIGTIKLIGTQANTVFSQVGSSIT